MEDMLKKNLSLSLKILNENIVPVLYKSFKNMPVEFKNYKPSQDAPALLTGKNEDESMQKLKKALTKFMQKKKMQKYKKAVNSENEYTMLFKTQFQSLEEFYKQVLHAYTIPGFLYLRMNEYLRSEDWTKLDNLLIYTYCLFKGYLWGPTGLTDADSFAYLKSKTNNGKLMLYRRADFDQGSLDFYHLDKIKEFSWSGVTSTSLIESATRFFAGKDSTKKPVLIVIEVDFRGLQPESFNALYLAKLSRRPKEEEVALAPGSIFELLDIHRGKPEVEIRLKLVTNAKVLAQQGKFLHGMLQAAMRNENELKIVCLREKELSRAIKHCKENLLIQDLEFTLCEFNQNAFEILLEIIPTLKNLASFSLNSVVLKNNIYLLEKLIERLGVLKIKKLEILTSLQKTEQIERIINGMRYLGSLHKMKLTFAQIDEKLIKFLYGSSLQYLSPQCVFEFKIQGNWSISSKQGTKSHLNKHIIWTLDPQYLSYKMRVLENSRYSLRENSDLGFIEEGINNLFWDSQVKGLSFRVNDCQTLSKLGFLHHYFKSLLTLHVSLEADSRITDESLDILKNIRYLGSLETLHLSFEACHQITDEGLKFLTNLRYLDSLTTLHLNFKGCFQISNQSIEFIQDIPSLRFLKVLHLNFQDCPQITERTLKFPQDTSWLKSLTSLHLNFKGCNQTFDQASLVSHRGGGYHQKLFNDHPKFPTSPLGLFSARSKFSNGSFGLFNDRSESFTPLPKLSGVLIMYQEYRTPSIQAKSLAENPEELLVDFCDVEDLRNRNGLKTLYFRFCDANEATDLQIKELGNQLSTHSKTLTNLYLNFSDCTKITGVGFKDLIKDLKSLTNLYLNFSDCTKITGVGFKDLIKDLKSLTNLHINFYRCSSITDKGLESLSQSGIQHLKFLEKFSLNLKWCTKIADAGLTDLFSKGIQHLKYLTDLHINFYGCSSITDKGLESLSQSKIQQLEFLKNLHLNFNECTKITDEGLQIFCKGVIQPLKSLDSVLLCIPSGGIQEELENNLFKADSLISYAMKVEGFSLKRSSINLKNEQKDIEDSEKIPNKKTLAHLLYSRKPILREEEKYFILGESLRTFHGLDQNLSSEENQKFLHLTFFQCERIVEKLLKSFFFSGTTILSSLLVLNLNFQICLDITDEAIKNLACQAIQNLDALHTLHLSFEGCCSVTDKGLKNLCYEGVWHLRSLKNLKLVFDRCWQITSEGLGHIFNGNTQSLGSITTLYLSFSECYKITDQGLQSLYLKGIRHLKSLESLYLNFNWCQNITDEGGMAFCCQGIKNLKSLKSLDLNFDGCLNITDYGLETLSNHGIPRVQSLESLNLSFVACLKVTDQGLKILNDKGIEFLKSLRTLNLNFEGCCQITDEGFQSFSSKVVQQKPDLICQTSFRKISLSSLESISSDKSCHIHTKTEIKCVDRMLFALASAPFEVKESLGDLLLNSEPDEIQKPEALRSLKFEFSQITDDDLHKINFEKERRFDNLETCQYIFDGCNKLVGSDSGFLHFCHQGIRNFKSLTTLHISFTECPRFAETGIKTLFYEGIRYLESLVELSLSFNECLEITDEGVKTIFHEGIDHLKRLEMLSLSFDGFNQLTDAGFQSLCRQEISRLKSLKSLSLNVNVQGGISDEILLCLCCEAIQKLDSLTSFQLIFKNGDKITDKGLKSLISEGMPRLLKLENIQLSFPQNLKVSPTIYQAFLRIMFYFGFESNSDSI